MFVYTCKEWEAIQRDPGQSKKVLEAATRCLVLLGSSTYQGLKDFRLDEEEVLEVEPDLELLTDEELKLELNRRRARHAKVRKALLEPSTKTVDRILTMVHLDLQTKRSAVGAKICFQSDSTMFNSDIRYDQKDGGGIHRPRRNQNVCI